MPTELTTAQAAEVIGCQPARVRQLAAAGTLKGRKLGRDWLIDLRAAERYAANKPKRGPKPKKGKA